MNGVIYMKVSRVRLFAIAFILILVTSSTLGCTLFNEDEEEKPPQAFTLEDLIETVPKTYSQTDPAVESSPTLNQTHHKPVGNIVASWYFEKNTIYTEFGGTLKMFIQNNGTDRLYVYRIGIKPEWWSDGASGDRSDDGVFAYVGKYVNASEKEFVGLLYFPGPETKGEYDYNILFSVYLQNTTGAWIDFGNQEGSSQTFEVESLPLPGEYKEHYNVRQYYDKINGIKHTI